MSKPGPHWRPAYVGLGSNLDSPQDHVLRAFDDLARLPDTLMIARSPLYQTTPLGPVEQADFINAAAALLTLRPARDLLQSLHGIEQQHGRKRDGTRWGPRELDLDLLVFAAEKCSGGGLTLPHPGIAERNFVLLPLSEIAPHLEVPGLGSVSRLLSSLPQPDAGIQEFVAARD